MADLVMIAMMVGFVLLCVAYVHWCDRIIAHDQDDQGAGTSPATAVDPQIEQVAA